MKSAGPPDPLARLRLTSEMLRLVAEIDEFKGAWRALGDLAPARLSSLRRVATVESVASSTRIEGVQLSDEEVDRLLSGVSLTSFRSRDEQEVAGYGEAMALVFEAHADMAVTEALVKQLHGILLKYSEKDVRHRGRYKKLSNHIEAFDADGQSLGVIFETASPFDTPAKTVELLEWLERSRSAAVHHPLLVIGTFVVWFLAIHPFQDGNGRLSRILTTLLLLRAGYAYVPYSSLERVIEQNKDEYYRTLRRAQKTLGAGEARLHEWLLFFLRALRHQKAVLARKVERERMMSSLSEIDAQILELVAQHGRVTVRLASEMTGTARSTAKAHLRRLVDAGRLRLCGRGRASWYERA